MNTEISFAPAEGTVAKQSWSTPALTVLSVASETAAMTAAGGDAGMTSTAAGTAS